MIHFNYTDEIVARKEVIMSKSRLGKLSTMTFIGITCAFVGSIRNIPDVAAAGWTSIFYLVVGGFMFGAPVVLLAAEFGGMFPEDGGMELWVTNSLGKKWGFIVSWLLWVQMFPAMVLIASSLPPMLGIIVGDNSLGLNNVFNFAVIIIVYWIVTLLNLKFDMAKVCGNIGVWFGLYIPLVMMLVMGIAATIKIGLDPHGALGSFEWSKIVPDSKTRMSLQYFTPIMFVFLGQEMSAVYIKRLEKPTKTYLIGAFSALIFLFILNTTNALMLANVVPAGKIQLDNTSQSVEIYTKILGLPEYMPKIFSAFVAIGLMVQVTAWATGPAKTVTSSARRGFYPPKLKFWKLNSLELSTSVMLCQAVIISCFAVLFLVVPGINQVILVLANSAVIQYSIAYTIMAIAIVSLRRKHPEIKRPFKVGNNTVLYIVVLILLLSIGVSTIFTFLTSSFTNNIVVVTITCIMFGIPFIIDKKRNINWESEVENLIKEDEEEE